MTAPTVAWRIWAHPIREEWAKQLQLSLDRHVPIVYDDNPEPSKNPQQRWDVCKRVLSEAATEGADYVGWIQDDALVCRHFTASVDAALHAAGAPILLSPYTGTGRPDQRAARRAIHEAHLAGNHWMSLRSMYWGVCIVFPAKHVADVISLGSRSVFKHSPSDYRVGVVLRDRIGLRTWHTLPSLVEHRDEGSLVGHDKRGQPRVAHNFIGTTNSGLNVDWTRRPAGALDADGHLTTTLR